MKRGVMTDWIIASFTITGANANFLENTRDSIEGGKMAALEFIA